MKAQLGGFGTRQARIAGREDTLPASSQHRESWEGIRQDHEIPVNPANDWKEKVGVQLFPRQRRRRQTKWHNKTGSAIMAAMTADNGIRSPNQL